MVSASDAGTVFDRDPAGLDPDRIVDRRCHQMFIFKA
jgi:hypothetical protein